MVKIARLTIALWLFVPQLSVASSQQVTVQDLESILAKADKLLEEAKAAYEEARSKSATSGFVDAGFKLEEARIKYLVLQEVGQVDLQKVAADRLRAVNQLSKLIHDGKVAISGNSVDAPPGKSPEPVNPPSGGDTAAKPPPASVSPPPDVSKRSPIPEAAKQKEAEKLVRELFKEQYSKKPLSDRKVLCRMLLDQSERSRDDPAATWVLLREAYDVAIQAGLVSSALDAVDASARLFDVEGIAMKGVALAALGKAAKTPEDFSELADASLLLTEEMVSVDQFDAAEKLAASAVTLARRAGDTALVVRASIRTKEVSEAKTLFLAMKGVLETLARNPDDPSANLEMGRFICFVKGGWDLGLRFMIKGSDAALKALADKELSAPVQLADRITLADGWYDLAEKEKSQLRRSQLQTHARSIYEVALPEATALVRARIEKRLADLVPAVPPGPVDLIRRVDLTKDTVSGVWKLESRGLLSPVADNFARLHLPYAPPEEYDLKVVLERKEKGVVTGAGGFYVGLVKGDKHFGVELDSGEAISRIFVQPSVPGTEYKGPLLSDGKSHIVVYKVRKAKVEVKVDDKSVLNWDADYDKVYFNVVWKPADPRQLLVATCFASYNVKQAVLIPVTGTGKFTH
jgi:hypothetical protein